MKRRMAMLLVVALVFVGAGCGGDDDTESADSGGAAAVTTTAAAGSSSGSPTSAASGSGSSSTGTATDSCSLLTTDQLKSVVGTDFDSGQDILGSCEYASKDKSRNVSAELLDAAKYADRKGQEGMQAVTGLGDEAFRDTTNGFFYVKKGAKAFRVNITGTGATNASTADATRKLAELILARV